MKKDMLTNTNSKELLLIVLFAVLFCITIGYAYLTSSLNINGTGSIKNPTWDIHFENVQVNDESVTASTPVIDSLKTTVTYSVHLTKPGDFYEFTVDVVNAGTIDAMIDSISSQLNDVEIESLPSYLEYDVKYADGGELAVHQLLPKGESETVKIRVGYKLDVSADDLPETAQNLEFSFTIVYVQATRDAMERNPRIISILQKDATTDQWIKFYEVNGTTNGNGVFLRDGTENDAHPIYYYRGNITNNNIIFGDFCWQIVRTTDTGGIKIMYNGVPNNGQCTNTGSRSTIGLSRFNNGSYSLADACYSFGKRYIIESSFSCSGEALFGSSLDTDGKLLDTVSSRDVSHPYTYCSNDPNYIADEVWHILQINYNNNVIAMSFDRTKSLEDVLSEMLDSNENKSVVHQYVDEWYEHNILGKYDSYLEDTEFCLSRNYSSDSWSQNGVTKEDFSFSSAGLMLKCSDPIDRLSVSNGSLDYPVALLTYDEVTLAGTVMYTANGSNYLKIGSEYWLLDPQMYYTYGGGSGCFTSAGCIGSDGSKYGRITSATEYVRPVVSLKAGTRISSGTGEPTDPYIIKTD